MRTRVRFPPSPLIPVVDDNGRRTRFGWAAFVVRLSRFRGPFLGRSSRASLARCHPWASGRWTRGELAV